MIAEAAAIIDEYFSSRTALGVIRIQESPYYRSELKLAEFIEALRDLFPLAPIAEIN